MPSVSARVRPPLVARLVVVFVGLALLAACVSVDTSSDDDAGADTTSSAGSEPTSPSSAADPDPGGESTTDASVDGAAPAPAATTTPSAPSTGPTPTRSEEPPARSYDFATIDEVVARFVDDRDLNGAGLVVVERDDGIVHEEYWGDFDADRISFIASSSKMVTAGVLLHLEDQGLIDLDAPVADAVEWGSGNPDITVAQLLSNSSGLVGLTPNPAYAPYLCQFLPAGSLRECGAEIFTTDADDADIAPPDTEYRYGGAQWQVAGAVAEAVSGKSWAQLIDEIYVEPCGLTTLGYNNHWTQLQPGGFDYPDEFDGDLSLLADTDNPNMEGGAYTNARDYASLLLMHLRDGVCGDTQVLSTESLARMHSDRIGPTYGGTNQAGGGYGFGWWTDDERGVIYDPGAYGAVPWLDLGAGYGAYLVVEASGSDGIALAFELIPLVADAIDALRAG